jgi:2-(1,2-epoxy-1,2-dihydrophenyl)acetyl-CoA isomerase
VIAAVNGVAAGAGVSLALACDLVYAADDARFIQAFVRIGLVPDSGSTRTLVRALGRHRAAALIFSGEPLAAAAAHEVGLVNQVVPATELASTARSAALALAAAPTRAIALGKRLINAAEDDDLATNLELEAALQELAGRTDDHAEGVAAFGEKREPRFLGH